MVMGEKITTQLTHATFCLFCGDLLVCSCMIMHAYVCAHARKLVSLAREYVTSHLTTQPKRKLLVV